MTTLCIGILQRVDVSVRETQAVILTNSDGDARIFRSIITDLCHGDTGVCEAATIKLSPLPILVDTIGPIHDMIIHQTASSDHMAIYCVDDGERVFSRHSSGHMNNAPLGSALQSIHNWLPKDIQTVVALSTITDDVVEATTQIMSHPMTIAVHDEDAYDDDEER